MVVKKKSVNFSQVEVSGSVSSVTITPRDNEDGSHSNKRIAPCASYSSLANLDFEDTQPNLEMAQNETGIKIKKIFFINKT